MPVLWEGELIFQNTETDDGRFINADALDSRELPLPLMSQTETAWEHQGAVIAGRIDEIEFRPDGTVFGRGVFDDNEAGAEGARLVREGMITGVSADICNVEAEIEVIEIDENGMPTKVLERLVKGTIMGATQTPFPAFAKAQLRLVDGSVDESSDDDDDEKEIDVEDSEEDVIAASANLAPATPPVTFFANPNLPGPTPITITDDGRIYGHIATWGTCHIGREDICLTAPSSEADYAYFATGMVRCDDDCEVSIGVITLGIGHAELGFDARRAAAHYDNTGTQAADIAVGEDDYGIWCAGAVRPGLTDAQVRELRASSLSGDWRRIGGSLELVAVLAVNVPGFPIPRARVASGHEMALVAAASPHSDNVNDIVTKLTAEVDTLRRFVTIESRMKNS